MKFFRVTQNPISVMEIPSHISSLFPDRGLNVTPFLMTDVMPYDPTIDRAPIRRASAYLLEMLLKDRHGERNFTVKSELTSHEQFYLDWITEKTIPGEMLADLKHQFDALIKRKMKLYNLQVDKQEAAALLSERHPEQLPLLDSMQDDNLFLIFNDKNDYCSLMSDAVEEDTSYCAYMLLEESSSSELLQNKAQRIYGTTWESEVALKQYQAHCEEVRQSDHRVIGTKQNLFHIDPFLSSGMPFWHEKGWQVYLNLVEYIRGKLKKFGYHEVNTPQVLNLELWKRSGHYEKYRENMFTVSEQHGAEDVVQQSHKDYALKPMSCPGHITIFNHERMSENQLPYRMSEFGHVHRNEGSGSLTGLARVRSLTQDDGHIFCTQEQIQAEVAKFAKEVLEVYQEVGFDPAGISVKIALRPEKRIGDDETWDKAESALCKALDENKLSYELLPGEGAFYGPKVEFHLKDVRGRSWQCGTIQLDYQLPEKLNAHYFNARNEETRPVMLHRAIFGSIERFYSILLEHYSAKLPLWLAPTQVVLLTVPQKEGVAREQIRQYAEQIKNELAPYYRIVEDLGNEELLAAKVGRAEAQKAPWTIIIGHREAQNKTLSVRGRDHHSQTMTLLAFMEKTLCDTSKAMPTEMLVGVLEKKKQAAALISLWQAAKENKLADFRHWLNYCSPQSIEVFRHEGKLIREIATEHQSRSILQLLDSNLSDELLAVNLVSVAPPPVVFRRHQAQMGAQTGASDCVDPSGTLSPPPSYKVSLV